MVRPDELPLLRTILARDDDESLQWYGRWIQSADLERVDAAGFRLLPMLYKRLERTGRPFAHLTRLKGVYRQSFYRNNLHFHTCLRLLEEIEKRGLPCVLLKGAALVAAHYDDVAVRAMNDVDFLVREEHAQQVLGFLLERGWSTREGVPPRVAGRHVHALQLYGPRGFEMDLHWRLVRQCPWRGADHLVWEKLETVDFRGMSVRIPGPTHQLLHTCVHGIQWNKLPPIRWIVDAMKILEKRRNDIDWDLLVSEAENRRLSMALTHALDFLNGTFDAGIPAEALRRLSALPRGPIELRFFRKRMSPPKFADIDRWWLIHSLGQGNISLWRRALAFPVFLRDAWSLASVLELPVYALKRIRIRVARILRDAGLAGRFVSDDAGKPRAATPAGMRDSTLRRSTSCHSRFVTFRYAVFLKEVREMGIPSLSQRRQSPPSIRYVPYTATIRPSTERASGSILAALSCRVA